MDSLIFKFRIVPLIDPVSLPVSNFETFYGLGGVIFFIYGVILEQLGASSRM